MRLRGGRPTNEIDAIGRSVIVGRKKVERINGGNVIRCVAARQAREPRPQKEGKSTANEGTDFKHIRNRTPKSRIVLTDRSLFLFFFRAPFLEQTRTAKWKRNAFCIIYSKTNAGRKRNAMNRYDFGVFTVRRRPYCCGCAYLERACECALGSHSTA